MDIPFIGYSRETLNKQPKAVPGQFIMCTHEGCTEGTHQLIAPEPEVKDSDGNDAILYYMCCGRSYVGAVGGRVIVDVAPDVQSEASRVAEELPATVNEERKNRMDAVITKVNERVGEEHGNECIRTMIVGMTSLASMFIAMKYYPTPVTPVQVDAIMSGILQFIEENAFDET